MDARGELSLPPGAASAASAGHRLDHPLTAVEAPVRFGSGPAAFVRRALLGIDPREASPERRGFRCSDAARSARLERIGRAFLSGYAAALCHRDPARLAADLEREPDELTGFRFEGAAMSLALLDALTPWRRSRWHDFSSGPGARHVYLAYVGAGWAMARIPWLRARPARFLERTDLLLRWLVLDGYGFHEGYFHPKRAVRSRAVPPALRGYQRRAFDQGLGRSLWFVEGADVRAIAETVDSFVADRRADLWSGVGLACAYAGGADAEGIRWLQEAAGSAAPALGQGAAFAAQARTLAGNPTRHTELACRLLCDRSVQEAGELTERALRDLRDEGALPSYEVWRRRIQSALAGVEAWSD